MKGHEYKVDPYENLLHRGGRQLRGRRKVWVCFLCLGKKGACLESEGETKHTVQRIHGGQVEGRGR